MNAPTQGRIVCFTPSRRTLTKFKNKQKEVYTAIITDVNEGSIDLTVFGVGEVVHVANVQHSTVAQEGRSTWDWPHPSN